MSAPLYGAIDWTCVGISLICVATIFITVANIIAGNVREALWVGAFCLLWMFLLGFHSVSYNMVCK